MLYLDKTKNEIIPELTGWSNLSEYKDALDRNGVLSERQAYIDRLSDLDVELVTEESCNLQKEKALAVARIDKKRRELLKKEKVKFQFNGILFDGNDSEITVSAKENIQGVYMAVNSLPESMVASFFPMPWRTFENQNYDFETLEEFDQFYGTFVAFRVAYEKAVNQKTFLAKDSIASATTFEEIAIAENILSMGRDGK